jgi:hypothetical protein
MVFGEFAQHHPPRQCKLSGFLQATHDSHRFNARTHFGGSKGLRPSRNFQFSFSNPQSKRCALPAALCGYN